MDMGAASTVDIGTLIVSRPGVNGGRPCLAGTGMSVRAIAVRHKRSKSAEEILDQFPHLDLARIHAALAYYYANREQIETDLEADRRLGEELQAKYPQGWDPETISA
jgi:uncharacterized protein (DUF433 family)